jgi:hypothetical protein
MMGAHDERPRLFDKAAIMARLASLSPERRERNRKENRAADHAATRGVVAWLLRVSSTFREWAVGHVPIAKLSGRPATTTAEIARQNAIARRIVALPVSQRTAEIERVVKEETARRRETDALAKIGERTVRKWITRVKKEG